ncbi:MAG: thiamine diphosphokinase [Bacteroidales bacterium]|nr:thiamine diphosphokinase [Bacteroidales bacterium]
MNTIILANGIFPQHPIALNRLLSASLIVCCDAAIINLANHLRSSEPFANALKGTDGEPITVAVVGDGDSYRPDPVMEQLFAEAGSPLRHYADADQETNDLTKAIRYASHQGARQLEILGATGLREDHTLGNIALLAHHSDLFSLRMYTDYGVFTPIHATTRFASFARQQVSLFNMRPAAATLSSKGLQYPLIDRHLDELWEGTLNASMGEEFTIVLDALSEQQPQVLVYQTYEAKESK